MAVDVVSRVYHLGAVVEDEAVKALESGAVVAGRYRVLRCIKAGGMGAVYEVADANTRRRLALKTLRPGIVPDTALLGRFEQEANITASIDSEHVVKVEDFGVDRLTSLVFFTMDLLAGRDLDTVLKEEGALLPERVASLLWQVAMALSVIHDAGIVHRDLKPENLFVKRSDDHKELVKILDFGVAKVLESDPKTTAFVGTPLYMPPEQLRGEQPDARTDVYALGQVAFTLLTGHAYLERGYAEEPASHRAARFGVTLPLAFDAWFERATAVKVAQRYDTATELVLALYLALRIEPPIAQHPPRRASTALPAAEVAAGDLLHTLGSGNLDQRGLESQSTVAVSDNARMRGRDLRRPGAVFGVLLAAGVALVVGRREVALLINKSLAPKASAQAQSSAALPPLPSSELPVPRVQPAATTPVLPVPNAKPAGSEPSSPPPRPKPVRVKPGAGPRVAPRAETAAAPVPRVESRADTADPFREH